MKNAQKFNQYSPLIVDAFYKVASKRKHMNMSQIAHSDHMSRRTLYYKLHKYNILKVLKEYHHQYKPFIPWMGNKQRILNQLDNLIPNQFDRRYNTLYEPFAGGASFSLNIAPKHLILNDNYRNIYQSYLSVKYHPRLLIKSLQQRMQKNSKQYYYQVRDKFNHHNINGAIQKSSAFFYIINTSYHHELRYNRKNDINIAYGYSKKEPDYKDILRDSRYLNSSHVHILNKDFVQVFHIFPAHPRDLVFLDPPYTGSDQRTYGYKPFHISDLNRLHTLMFHLSKQGVYCIMTNYDTSTVDRMFGNDFNFQTVLNQKFSKKKTHKKKYKEVIITNF